MKLDKKVVLITGGTTGIGAATARLFQAEDATVIVTGSAQTVQAAKPTLPGVEVLVADQADTQAQGAWDQIKARYAASTSVCHTGSTAGSKGGPGMSVYSASKAAVRSLARTFAAELAPRNIRVNVISPGPIETPIFGKVGLSQEQLDGWLESSKQRIPLGRIGHPEEVAITALFLAADASFTTGAEIFVGGGMVDV